MELLVCVVNREDKLDDILSGFLELGVKGATVVQSEGMGRVLSSDVPVFSGLKALLSSRVSNTMVMSVIESPQVMEKAIAMVQSVCGNLEEPSTGILFTIPVSRVVGLAPELPPANS